VPFRVQVAPVSRLLVEEVIYQLLLLVKTSGQSAKEKKGDVGSEAPESEQVWLLSSRVPFPSLPGRRCVCLLAFDRAGYGCSPSVLRRLCLAPLAP
jgi:hypothetical protein